MVLHTFLAGMFLVKEEECKSESWKWSLHIRQELAAFHGSGSLLVC